MSRPRFGKDWAGPTMLGALLGMWVVTTVDALLWDELGEWGARMLRATAVGLALGVLLLAVDVVLLARKVRALPRTRAFGQSFAAPCLGSFLWVLGPWDLGPGLSAWGLGGKLLLIAVTVRLLTGKLPGAAA